MYAVQWEIPYYCWNSPDPMNLPYLINLVNLSIYLLLGAQPSIFFDFRDQEYYCHFFWLGVLVLFLFPTHFMVADQLLNSRFWRLFS